MQSSIIILHENENNNKKIYIIIFIPWAVNNDRIILFQKKKVNKLFVIKSVAIFSIWKCVSY